MELGGNATRGASGKSSFGFRKGLREHPPKFLGSTPSEPFRGRRSPLRFSPQVLRFRFLGVFAESMYKRADPQPRGTACSWGTSEPPTSPPLSISLAKFPAIAHPPFRPIPPVWLTFVRITSAKDNGAKESEEAVEPASGRPGVSSLSPCTWTSHYSTMAFEKGAIAGSQAMSGFCKVIGYQTPSGTWDIKVGRFLSPIVNRMATRKLLNLTRYLLTQISETRFRYTHACRPRPSCSSQYRSSQSPHGGSSTTNSQRRLSVVYASSTRGRMTK